jgi:Leucine-rich repeat (LRR) protein
MEFEDLDAAKKDPAQVTALTIDGTKLRKIPPELAQMVNLEKLTLRSVGKPDWSGLGLLAKLPKLTELSLRSNKIEDVPPEIGALTRLRSLRLDFNNLDSLPKEIAQLGRLEELVLDHNCFTGLPPHLDAFPRLRRLVLGHNPITALSGQIGLLTNLEELSLFNTYLKTLPPEIGKLTKLQSVWLVSNRNLETLPRELLQLPSLKRLAVSLCGSLKGIDELRRSLPNVQLDVTAPAPAATKPAPLPASPVTTAAPQAPDRLDGSWWKSLDAEWRAIFGKALSAKSPSDAELGKLATLTHLDIAKTQVTNLAPLAAMPKLEVLDLSGCKDLTDFRGLPASLRILTFHWIALEDLSFIDGLPNLEKGYGDKDLQRKMNVRIGKNRKRREA